MKNLNKKYSRKIKNPKKYIKKSNEKNAHYLDFRHGGGIFWERIGSKNDESTQSSSSKIPAKPNCSEIAEFLEKDEKSCDKLKPASIFSPIEFLKYTNYSF